MFLVCEIKIYMLSFLMVIQLKPFIMELFNLKKKIVIFHVLYILEFSFNIILVHRLIKDLNCKLCFCSKNG